MEYRLLGTLEVVHEGRRVPIERRLSRVLLAFLLLHANEPVSVDRLVDELWGEAPPPTAKASLQNHVHRLRKALGAETIVLRAGAYELRVDPEEIDLRRFERLVAEARDAGVEERATMLRAALALWRGPPLEDQVFSRSRRTRSRGWRSSAWRRSRSGSPRTWRSGAQRSSCSSSRS
jgi:DNA-binding SARP family transcriptional activator